ncbi:MAG: DUF2191 domain-containing protein [Deltaproteobacteria bacterium]|nr:MAG: DUF2191 domain-containing protein [Deltaproteobacteria bacterium]
MTNLAIDSKLIEHVLKVSGESTVKDAVTRALQEFIARREEKSIVDILGKLEWDETYNYKSERSC